MLPQVDRQSQYIQGYRLLYRPSGGTWLLHDVNSPSERGATLTDLLKGTQYEVKIRPYFDEFQGKDSRTLLLRTPEEGTYGVCCALLFDLSFSDCISSATERRLCLQCIK